MPIEHDLASRMHDVADALKKMDDGTYGICEVSGEEIPFDRLIANSAARTCIAHS